MKSGKFTTLLSLSLLCLMTMTACREKPVSGYVVGKRFDKAHNSVRYNVILKMPMTTHYPDRWFILVADSLRVRSVTVSREAFETVRKGELISIEKGVIQKTHGEGDIIKEKDND